jgi:hypothetical protein
MKLQIRLFYILFLTIGYTQIYSQEDITITSNDSEVVEGLDLHAVGDLFKGSETLEDFEKDLNDPEKGINNLDLDGNNEVDYIRVVEETEDNIHIIILQVPLSKDEFQDVATIEVEKSGDNYNLQIHGNDNVYGTDYYVSPVVVHVHTWPIINLMYRPIYKPYRSAFYFGFYPHWWRPYRPIAHHLYHKNVFHRRSAFTVTKTTRIKTVHYKPHTSKVVVKKTKVTKTGKTKTVKKTKVKVR